MGIMSPNRPVQNRTIETKVKDSVRGQLQECFPTKEDRGESVQPESPIVQDLNDVDVVQASDRVQQWEEEQT